MHETISHFAYAQAAPAARQPGFMDMLPMMLIIFGIFYFFLIRPQQKEQREHQSLLAGLQKGDKVVTASGVHGRIWEVGEATVQLEVADRVRITVDKLAIKRK